jgi:gliding motility-associated-like protein
MTLLSMTISKFKHIGILISILLQTFFSLAQNESKIHVVNNCPFPIWSHAFAVKRFTSEAYPINDGYPLLLNSGDTLLYDSLPQIGGGRIYGYYKEPPMQSDLWAPLSSYNQFVEMTVETGWMNYNISYVDHAALPVSMWAIGNCDTTETTVTSKEWKKLMEECPTKVLHEHNDLGSCYASYDYCLQYPDDEYCTKMVDAYEDQARQLLYDNCIDLGKTVGECESIRDNTLLTANNFYGGLFDVPSENVLFWDWVAAWHRGTFAGNYNEADYYNEPQQIDGLWTKPYNEYAKWVHEDIGSNIYSFSTDDHQEKSGFQRCEAEELYVTWCPYDTLCHLIITDIQVTDVDCYGDATGAMTIADSGGIAPIQYSLDTGATWSDIPTFENLNAGTYKVYVKGQGSCIDSAIVEIRQPVVSAHIYGDTILCNDGEQTAPITVELEGNAPWSLTYSIDGVEQAEITNINSSPFLFNSIPGAHQYEISAVSSNVPCSGNEISGKVNIDVYDSPEAQDITYCPPETATFTVTDNGGSYQWYDVANGGTALFTGTSYDVQLTDNTGASFYVQDNTKVSYSSGSFGFQSDTEFPGNNIWRVNNPDYTSLKFTAKEDLKLNEITGNFDIYGYGTGHAYVSIEDLDNGFMFRDTIEVSCEGHGPDLIPIPLNLNLNKDHQYKITLLGEVGLLEMRAFTDWTPGYPLDAGMIEINESYLNDDLYPGIFKWDMTWGEKGAECRTLVQAIANCDSNCISPVNTNINTDQSLNFCSYDSILMDISTSIDNPLEANFNYAIFKNNLLIEQNSNGTFTIEDTGSYFVIAFDSICADTSNTLNINRLPVSEILISKDTIICPGTTIDITANGGATYLWSTMQTKDTIQVTPTSDSVFTVAVTDNNGCSQLHEVQISLHPNLFPDAGINDTICKGDSRFLIANGGAHYVWNTGENTNEIKIQPTSTSTYSVTIMSAQLCTAIDSAIVVVMELPIANAGKDTSICAGNLINLNATGGISYEWNNGTTSSINQVAAGTTYIVTVTDESGCTDSDEVVVSFSPGQIPEAGNNDSICIGDSTILQASGGSLFIWNTGDSTNAISVDPIQTTTFKVTVTSNDGCSGIDSVIVKVNELPQPKLGDDRAICPNESTVIAALPDMFSYKWSGGENQAAIMVTPDTTTTYTVSITNDRLCSASENIVVQVKSAPNMTIDTILPLCKNASAVALSGQSANGYFFGDGVLNGKFHPSVTDTTIVTIYYTADEHNCSDTISSRIMIYPVPEVLLEDQTVCESNQIELGEANQTDGDYRWSNGETEKVITLSPSSNTTYALTITSNDGCTERDTANITMLESPKVDFFVDKENGCRPHTVSFMDASSLSGIYYIWDFGDQQIFTSNTGDINHTYFEKGDYNVSLTVISADSCIDSSTQNKLIQVYDPPKAEFTYSPRGPSNLQPEVHFTNQSEGDINSYSWVIEDKQTSYYSKDMSHRFTTSGEFQVSLIVENEYCHDETSQYVIVEADHTIYIPTAFTPDGDGVNDEFKIEGIDISNDDFRLYVFTRWGEEIYTGTDINKGWNGTKHNQGEVLPVGVYSWLVEYRDLDKKGHKLKGKVTILR